MGGYQPLVEQLPALRRIDRAALPGREKAWLDTILWLGERVSELRPSALRQRWTAIRSPTSSRS